MTHAAGRSAKGSGFRPLLLTLHRWCGAIVSIVLLAAALSGVALLYKEQWIALPHARDPLVQDTQAVTLEIENITRQFPDKLRTIYFARQSFGLTRVMLTDSAGAYTDQAGHIVQRWTTRWQRPELWLFELHSTLFTGAMGELLLGMTSILGLFFVLSGTVLWWPLRRSFHLRLLPQRMTRPAIVRYHRDLGLVAAPLLLITFGSSALMIFPSLSVVMLGPGAPVAIERAMEPPVYAGTSVAANHNWRMILETARRAFPDGEIRTLTVPVRPDDLTSLRLRLPEDPLPSGRTVLWFRPHDDTLVEARDLRQLSWQMKAYNTVYPIHAGKVGGWPWRIATALSGFAITLLAGFSLWSFWYLSRSVRPRR